MTCKPLAVMHQQRIINIYSIYSSWFGYCLCLGSDYAYNALQKVMLRC